MFTEERQHEILKKLKIEKRISVNDITVIFGVSESTARRDLQEMESKGLLSRTHGGAVLSIKTGYEAGITEKASANSENKKSIGRLAAGYIHKDETLFLDSGSTTLEIARAVQDKQVCIITNSIQIAWELSFSETVSLVMIGGELRKSTRSLTGSMSQEDITKLHVDKAFIGANGIDLIAGFTTPNMGEGKIKELMLRNSKSKFLVADSDKFDQVYGYAFASLKTADYLLTDNKISKDLLIKYKDAGCNIITENREC
jgi:DeoR family fructose operon transcriptional repressor